MATLQRKAQPLLAITWEFLAQPVVGSKRKARLRQDARRYQADDHLAERAELKEHLDYSKTADGFVYVENFSRDCDNCERNWVTKLPAHITALEVHQNRLFDSAEGLTYCDLITEGMAEEIKASFRDRNAEYYGY